MVLRTALTYNELCVSYCYGIAVPLVAGSDFVGGEFTLTLREGPSTISCVGVGITWQAV